MPTVWRGPDHSRGVDPAPANRAPGAGRIGLAKDLKNRRHDRWQTSEYGKKRWRLPSGKSRSGHGFAKILPRDTIVYVVMREVSLASVIYGAARARYSIQVSSL